MPSAKIRIVTDTTSALPLEYARAHHIEVVRQIINFGATSFLEGLRSNMASLFAASKRCRSYPRLPRRVQAI